MTGRITFMGAVPPWECDAVDHFTVAFYFQKLDSATVAALQAAGVDATSPSAPRMRHCRTRFVAELRKGDVYRIETVQLAADRLGHRLVNAEDGRVCTHFEQRLSAPLPALPAEDGVAGGWDGAVFGESSQPPPAQATWLETGRDAMSRADRGVNGRISSHACVLRFSAAGEHLRNRLGMTPGYARRENVGFATFAFHLQCLEDAAPGEPLAVQSRVVRVGRASLAIEHRLLNVARGVEVGTLLQEGAHFDKTRRRASPFPHHIIAAARRLLP